MHGPIPDVDGSVSVRRTHTQHIALRSCVMPALISEQLENQFAHSFVGSFVGGVNMVGRLDEVESDTARSTVPRGSSGGQYINLAAENNTL